MQVSKEHLGAIAKHVNDVLGGNKVEQSKSVIVAMVGDDPSYADFGQVDTAVVSEALKDAGVSVPALRRGTIAALFRYAARGTPVCDKCGRLPLRLEGSAWVTVAAEFCPVDDGMYKSPAEGESIIGWDDGVAYPAGTTKSAGRAPLGAAITDGREVHEWITGALKDAPKTSMSDLLAYLLASGKVATAPAALAVLTTPSIAFFEANDVRSFARKAGGATARGAHGGASTLPSATPFGPVANVSIGRLDGPSCKALQDALLSSFPSRAGFDELMYLGLNVNLDTIAGNGNLRTVAFDVVQWAESQGCVDRLVAAATRQNPGNPALRAFVASRAGGGSSDLITSITQLLPAQFEVVVFRLAVPDHYLPGVNAPLAERAVALVRHCEQGGRTDSLRAAIAAVTGHHRAGV